MTEIALVGSALMIVLALARTRPRSTGPRHLVYWWVMAAFGLQVLDLLLVATNVIAYDNQTLGIAFAVPELVVVVVLVSRAAGSSPRLSIGALLCVTPVVISLAFVLGGYSLITPTMSIV